MRSLLWLAGLMVLLMNVGAWCQEAPGEAPDEDEQIRKIVEERRRKEAERERRPTSRDGGATVNPELLTDITDNSIGLRAEERDAYFRVLELAWQTPLAEQQTFAENFREARRLSNPKYSKLKPEEFPVFVDLFLDPEAYRGRPVTLHGVMRKLTRFSPGENKRGIGDVFEGWVYPSDGQSNPVVVVFSSKPEGLPVGGDLTEEVRFTGYFFKMYGYEAHDVARKAPLLLAGAVEWKPSPAPYRPAPLGAEVYLLITMVVLVLGFVFWQGNRSEMKSALHKEGGDFRFGAGGPESRPTDPQDS